MGSISPTAIAALQGTTRPGRQSNAVREYIKRPQDAVDEMVKAHKGRKRLPERSLTDSFAFN